MGKKVNETNAQHLKRSLYELESKILKNGPETISAMVGETQLGTLVGDVPPQKNYWIEVSKILKKYDIHLILDEVYCGMGRSGEMFNYKWDNIDPDFVCVGKNTTSGCIPFSFVMSKKKFENIILNYFGRVNLGHTFQGHSLGAAATIATIDIIKSNHLLKKVKNYGKYIQDTLSNELGNNHFFSNVRGRGFAIALEHRVKNNMKFSYDLKYKMLNEYKILINSKFHRTSFLPSYTMSKSNIDKTIDCFIKIFKELSLKKYS